MVTFDWPGTSEATDCFPVVYEQDLDELASSHCRTKSGFLALLCALRKWPSCQQLKQNPNLGDWLADFPPHWLPPHNLLACLWGWETGKHGLPVQSHMWSGYMVRLLAVLACICSVKGINWSRRAVVCAVIWVVNLSPHAVTTLAFLAFNLNFSWWYGLRSVLRSCIRSSTGAVFESFSPTPSRSSTSSAHLLSNCQPS